MASRNSSFLMQDRTPAFAIACDAPAVGKGAVIMADGDRADFVIRNLINAIVSEYRWPARMQTEREVVPLKIVTLRGFSTSTDVPILHRAYAVARRAVVATVRVCP
jgi:hypothetical protein